jgi:hypothetical protein
MFCGPSLLILGCAPELFHVGEYVPIWTTYNRNSIWGGGGAHLHNFGKKHFLSLKLTFCRRYGNPPKNSQSARMSYIAYFLFLDLILDVLRQLLR